MSYNLKAKLKSTGEVVEFSALDTGDDYQYLEIKSDIYYSNKHFNDLFEIIDESELEPVEPFVDFEIKSFNSEEDKSADDINVATKSPEKRTGYDESSYVAVTSPEKASWEQTILKDWKIEYDYDNLKNGFTVKPSEVDFHTEQIAKYWTTIITQTLQDERDRIVELIEKNKVLISCDNCNEQGINGDIGYYISPDIINLIKNK